MRKKQDDLIFEIRGLEKDKAKLLDENYKLNCRSNELSQSLTEKNDRLENFVYKFQLQEKEWEEKIAELSNTQKGMQSELDEKKNILRTLALDVNKIEQSILSKKEEENILINIINNLQKEKLSQIDKLNNIKKDIDREQGEQLGEIILHNKKILNKKEEFNILEEEWQKLKIEIQENICAIGIREKDLCIYEKRLKQKYPNELI